MNLGWQKTCKLTRCWCILYFGCCSLLMKTNKALLVIYIFFHSSHYVCDGLISHWTNNWILFGYAVNNVHNIIWPAIISHCAHPTWLVSNNSLGPHCSILIWNLTFLTIFTDEGIVVILYALNANMLPVKCDVVI